MGSNFCPPLKKTSLQIGLDAASYSARMDKVVAATERARLFTESFPLRRNLLLRKRLSLAQLASVFPMWFTEEGVSNYRC